MTADAPARVSAIDVRRAVAELANSGTYMSLAMWNSVSERLLAGADALEDLRDSRVLTQAQAERIAALEQGMAKSNEDVCQTLGKALGYPWFKDDQANFPGSTEEHGVCVGEHVAESIAAEAARKIAALEAEVACWKEHALAEGSAANKLLDKANALLDRAEAAESSLAETRAKVEGLEKIVEELRPMIDADGKFNTLVWAERQPRLLAALSALPEAKPAAQADDAAPEVKS